MIQWALENNCLLLTENKDFGEWVFAHPIKDLSVLSLRYRFTELAVRAATVCAAIVATSCICNDHNNKIRVRQL
ncbi:hypothetical protein [Niabella ginsenosidivorans]|uniref:hypothetical protein n=1 Tax=Niabella ginsenosidivorans TaxID=1176587 RepID=UPI00373FCD1E